MKTSLVPERQKFSFQYPKYKMKTEARLKKPCVRWNSRKFLITKLCSKASLYAIPPWKGRHRKIRQPVLFGCTYTPSCQRTQQSMVK